MLCEDVRGAKEMLSRTSNADIHLPALEVDATSPARSWSSWSGRYLDRTVECLPRAIAAARARPAGPDRHLPGRRVVAGSRWPRT